MRVAFKEWAVVCRALAAGRQIVVLRKGGIVEDGGVFRAAQPEFLLFPTYSHQSPESVILEARVSFEDLEKEMPETGRITFHHFAVVTNVLRVESLEALQALRREHVWSDEVVGERFCRWRDHSIWAMIVRVSSLAAPLSVELKEEYTGCKSWIHLDEDVPTLGASPVIEACEFERRVTVVRNILIRTER